MPILIADIVEAPMRIFRLLSRLCYSLASICLSVHNVLWLNGASYNKSYY